MIKILKNIVFFSLCAIVTALFAGNDTISFIEYYTYDFESTTENNSWQFRHSTGKNKWTIGSYDDSNTCLYVSENKTDTIYNKKSASISLAYKRIFISAVDSLQIEFDVHIAGESNKDYLKIMVLPKDYDLYLPSPSSSALGFIGAYYKTNSFLFDSGNAYYSDSKGQKHIVAKMKTPFACDTALLVFVWRNDNSAGDNPPAMLDNISLKGIPTILQEYVCEGNSFVFNDKEILQKGIYCDTLQSVNGCDSIIYLQLDVKDKIFTNKDTTICSNQDFIIYATQQNYGKTLIFNDTTMTLTDTLISFAGCDSIVTYNLKINPANLPLESDTIEICQGTTYLFSGRNLTTGGEYFDTLQNRYGCDSIISLYLVVNPVYQIDTTVTIAKGDTHRVGESIYTKRGTYIDTLTSINGCDSIVTTKIKVSSSLEELSNNKGITVYPNPATDKIHINLQPYANKYVIRLIDRAGEEIKTIEVAGNQAKIIIDVKDLPKGIYILQVKNISDIFETKIVIQ